MDYVQQLKKITQASLLDVKAADLSVYKETLEKMKPSIENAARQGLYNVTFEMDQEMFSGVRFEALRSCLEADGFTVGEVRRYRFRFLVSWADRLVTRGGFFPSTEGIVYKS